jgi:hypothetical protein
MNTALTVLLALVVWILLMRYVFPKLGIKG